MCMSIAAMASYQLGFGPLFFLSFLQPCLYFALRAAGQNAIGKKLCCRWKRWSPRFGKKFAKVSVCNLREFSWVTKNIYSGNRGTFAIL